MDPNWFYSSLAQSAAAVIGLVGGFVISGLLRQREELAGHRQTLLELAREVVRAQANLFRPRAEWRDWWNAVGPDLRATGRATAVKIPTLGQSGVQGPIEISASPSDVAVLEKVAAQSEQVIQLLKGNALERLFRDPLGSTNWFFRLLITITAEDDLARRDWKPGDPHLRRLLADGDMTLQGMEQAYVRFREAYGRAEGGLTPRIYYLLLGLLALISLTGVIYPLSRLSAYGDTEKVVLTALFGFGLLALLGFMAFQIREVRRIIRIEVVDVIGPTA